MRLLIMLCLMVFSFPAMACVNPVATAGEIIMSSTNNVPQYCDGTNWIAMTSGRQTAAPTVTQVVPSGLVGHWRLDGSGYDSSGTGNNGVPTGPNVTWESDAVLGTGSVEIKSNSAIVVPQNASINSLNQITISAWVRGISGGGGYLVYKTNDFFINSNPSNQWFQFNASLWNVNPGRWRTPNNILPGMSSNWNHIAVTYNYSSTSNDPIIYVNGQSVTGVSEVSVPSGTVGTSNSDLYIGNNTATSNDWNDNIDDVRIYNRALTSAEVVEIYEARDGIRYNANHHTMEYFDSSRWVSMTRKWPEVTSGLVGHWKMDETADVTVADSSGSGHTLSYDGNGTCTNAGNTALGAVGRSLYLNSNSCNLSSGSVGATVLHNAASFSVGGWFKIDRVSSSNVRILERTHNTLGSAVSWAMVLDYGGNAGQVDFIIKDTGDLNFTGTWNGPYVAGRWYHFMGVKDGTAVQLFVNGVLVGSDTFAGTEANSTGILMLTDGYSERADYWADDIRYYNRALSAAEVQRLYNMGATVGATTALPQGCPVIGDICDDGTVYAGLSPDGNVAMFTTPADAGTFPWNNGNATGYTNAGLRGVTNTGAANTASLMTVDSDSGTPGIQPHLAAKHCSELVAHGADDWYLPATNELGILYDNHVIIGGFNLASVWYYASTEVTADNGARAIRFMDGNYGGNADKALLRPIRCVRKGPAPRCVNPYGFEGQLLFNDAHDVVQYCDGARWIAVGR